MESLGALKGRDISRGREPDLGEMSRPYRALAHGGPLTQGVALGWYITPFQGWDRRILPLDGNRTRGRAEGDREVAGPVAGAVPGVDCSERSGYPGPSVQP